MSLLYPRILDWKLLVKLQIVSENFFKKVIGLSSKALLNYLE